jgi:hypothetical protein
MWPPLASFMNSKGTIQCYSFVELLNHVYTRPARGGGRGGEIPGARSAQRGPEITVKCSYIVYHRQFPEGQGPVFTNRHFVPGTWLALAGLVCIDNRF